MKWCAIQHFSLVWLIAMCQPLSPSLPALFDYTWNNVSIFILISIMSGKVSEHACVCVCADDNFSVFIFSSNILLASVLLSSLQSLYYSNHLNHHYPWLIYLTLTHIIRKRPTTQIRFDQFHRSFISLSSSSSSSYEKYEFFFISFLCFFRYTQRSVYNNL